MPTGKTSTLTFRIEPALKEALRAAAAREHRSVANMVEVLIRDWCSRNGIAIPVPTALMLKPRTRRVPRENEAASQERP